MDDGFIKELTPDEIKMATIQFMGQHLTGEMKELNKNIIGQSATLRSLSLDPVKVLQTVPSDRAPSYANVVNAGINLQAPTNIPYMQPVQQPVVNQPQPQVDPNQLELDFSSSNLAKSIFDRLEAIDRKIEKLLQQTT